MAKGEKWFLFLLALIGLGWIAIASPLQFMDESIPSTGFVPVIFSILFTALVIAQIIVNLRKEKKNAAPNHGQITEIAKTDRKKILQVIFGLVAAIIAFDFIGALTSLFLLLVYLLGLVERRPIRQTLIVSVTTSLILFGLFKVWLGVPLPTGPLGF